MSLSDSGRNEVAAPESPRRLLLISGLVVLYAFTLRFSYREVVAPTFGYRGSTYDPPEWDFYLYGIILACAVACCLPRQLDRASAFVIWVLYVIVGAPSMLLGHYAGNLSGGQALATSAGMAAALVVTSVVSRSLVLRDFKIRRPSPVTFWLILGGFSILSYAYLYFRLGLQFSPVGLLEVYDVRDEYRHSLESAGGLSGYLVSWQSNVVNPAILVRGLMTRNPWAIAAAVLGQVVLYSTTGYKTIGLSVFAVAVVVFVAKRFPRIGGTTLVLGGALLPLATMVIDRISGSILASSLLVRRFLVSPGRSTAEYVQFFDSNPKVYLSNSVLAPWLEYPYADGFASVIGKSVTGASDVSMNANVFANGYAHAGWFGMIVAAAVLGVVLWCMDLASRDFSLPIYGGLLVMSAITLSNSALPTSLSTHGVALIVVVLALLPREGWLDGPRQIDRDAGFPVGHRKAHP